MALWGCYLLSFQTGLRGGHLYIFGEIVPIAAFSEYYTPSKESHSVVLRVFICSSNFKCLSDGAKVTQQFEMR